VGQVLLVRQALLDGPMLPVGQGLLVGQALLVGQVLPVDHVLLDGYWWVMRY
jgi:hypothetical protein